MKHRTQLEIDGLQRAEGVLDAAETFVGAHCRGGVGLRGWQIGADHIDAVERGLGGDAEGGLGTWLLAQIEKKRSAPTSGIVETASDEQFAPKRLAA
jgi:hypothetical protein